MLHGSAPRSHSYLFSISGDIGAVENYFMCTLLGSCMYWQHHCSIYLSLCLICRDHRTDVSAECLTNYLKKMYYKSGSIFSASIYVAGQGSCAQSGSLTSFALVSLTVSSTIDRQMNTISQLKDPFNLSSTKIRTTNLRKKSVPSVRRR